MKLFGMGARNISNFSACTSHGKLPNSKSSITYQGIISEHHFTLKHHEHEATLNIETEAAISPHETCNVHDDSYWLSLLMKSKFDGVGRDERPIDIVICLDVSGSMNSAQGVKSKLELAKIAITKVHQVMRGDDRLGMCTFSYDPTVVFPIEEIGGFTTEMLTGRLESITADGGENLSNGFSAGMELFEKWEIEFPHEDFAATGRERRILFMTDMRSSGGELGVLVKNAQLEKNIYTSVIGLGLDFNSELTEKIIKVPGANYFTTKDEDDLDQIMVEKFHYNFLPVCHGARVTFSSNDFHLVKVYGAPLDAETQSLDLKWLPRHHRSYPSDFRNTALTLLLSLRKRELKLPMIAFSTVMDFVAPRKIEVTRLETIFASPLAENNLMEGGLLLLKLKPKRILPLGEGAVGIGVRWKELDHKEGKDDRFIRLKSAYLKTIGEGVGNIDKGYALTRFVDTVHDLIDNKEKNRPAAEEIQGWLEELVLKFPEDDKMATRKKELGSLLSK